MIASGRAIPARKSFMSSSLGGGHVSTIGRFFDEMRRHEHDHVGRFQSFFRQFDDNYRRARSGRAANTPHLDVLRAFGLEFAELRHSAVLAWFLNPEAEHEQGALFTETFLGLCGYKRPFADTCTVVQERHGRTDVACYSRGEFAIFVENKVRHFEREQQVADMVISMAKVCAEIAVPRERRFAVYLTDAGSPAVTGPTSDTPDFMVANLKCVKRVTVFESFKAALSGVSVSSPLLVCFLDSYLNSIRRLRLKIR